MSYPQGPEQPQQRHRWCKPAAAVLALGMLVGGVEARDNDWQGLTALEHIVGGAGSQQPETPPDISATTPAAPSPSASKSPSVVHHTMVAKPDKPKHTASVAPSKPKVETKPVIVIDPGHSGKNNDVTSKVQVDGKTYTVRDHDYPNYPEIYEMFDVSKCTAQVLRADGYKAILTKKKALGTVTLAKRAEIANDAHADLAISVHDDHGQGPNFEAVYDQRGVKQNGEYPVLYRDAKLGGKAVHLEIRNQKLAKASHADAKLIAAEREKAQGHNVPFAMANIAGRAGLTGGNVWMVQDLSRVPWVYNEMGALTDGDPSKPMSLNSEQEYATGLVEGIRDAVPIAGAPDTSAHIGMLHSCLVAQQPNRPAQYRN